MIDIHTHILPYIDDGSKDLESSINLIKESVNFGVTDLFLTPHYMKTRDYLSTYEQNREVFLKLKEIVNELSIPIQLHLGNEIYYTIESIKNLRDKTVIPLGKTKMVLIEFSTIEEEDIAEAIHNIKALGYCPIIAHAERYSYLKSLSDYEIIKKMGGLIQINAGSVIGQSGLTIKKFIHKLIKNNLIDFVASDIHTFRKNYLKEAYDYVQKKYGTIVAEKLFNNRIMLT
ncbi:MAG: hypothetical protein KJ971_00570 [Firmicutes bacterium]|nr:hypothetical protein [Bacillota bacterium]